MSLSSQEKKYFRQKGHGLKSIITVAGKGLSEGVSAEVERALEDHELIKITVRCEDRDDKKAIIKTICEQHNAELVQAIGHIALIYRAAKKPNPKLSNILR